jgi:hypothetical protein
VGRLGIALVGAVGSAALPAGGAFRMARRTSRNEVDVDLWLSHEAPSREIAPALNEGLDLTRIGGALRVERTRVGDASQITGALAGLIERQDPTLLPTAQRTAALFAFDATVRQRDEDVRYQARLTTLGEAGRTADGAYLRQRTMLQVGTARGNAGLITATIQYGSIGGGGGSAHERFVVGGFDSPLIDPMYDARRVSAPAYPLGSAAGTTYGAYRLATPLPPFELFYEGISTDYFHRPLRSFGAELQQAVPPVPALGTPGVDVRTGIARAVDDPGKGRWRYYVTLSLRP